MKKALIIGSEGQDGTLLKLLLKSKNYEVYGIGKRPNQTGNELTQYISFDLGNDDFSILEDLILTRKPDEIYYVAALHQSSQQNSSNDFSFIEQSINVNQTAFIRILEICRTCHPLAHIVYTSSSLVFSGTSQQVQNETTVTEPRCIYSVTKCASMEVAKYYRNVHNLFVSVGIMYNHESKYRSSSFLSQKIISETQRLINKEIDKIKIGNLSAVTDWGYAPDYAEALWHILQLQSPDTFIVSSGIGHKVQDWFEVLFNYLNLNWKEVVTEDSSMMFRKKPILIGNNSKLLSTGWKPKVSFEEMVIRMYNNIL